jgi:hypothetical protein
LEKALKHMWFSPNPFDRVTQLMPEMREIDATEISPLAPFQRFPQAFPRLEFGGIRRQALQMHPWGCAIGQAGLADLTAMHGGAIPDDDHTAGNLAEERLQKGDAISRVHRVVLRLEVELALGREGADRR